MSIEKYQRGFSLIELIIVIGIIGVLTTIIFSTFSGFRESARDDRRLADLQQIQLAIELYKTTNGTYPPEDPDDSPGPDYTGIIGAGGAIDAVLLDHLGEVPLDPLDGDGVHYYVYDGWMTCGTGTIVVIFAQEMENSANANNEDACNNTWGSQNRVSGADGSYNIILQDPGVQI